MRAAAVALVLIVGAAVVLWYGNTLNSWVLGGLIGGLAALLLSIPISLTLFSYLSRRHEEQLQAEEQEDIATVQEEEAYYSMQAPAEVYESDAYLLTPPIERLAREQRTSNRNLPAPSVPRMPAARQNQPQQSMERQQYRQRANDYAPEPERQQRPATVERGRGNPEQMRRPMPAKPVRYPGFPGYQTNARRSYHQTAALRAARLEAAQQQDGDTDGMPHQSKRVPAVRSNQSVAKLPRTSRQLQPQQQTPSHYSPKRMVEGSSLPPGSNRALPRPAESSNNQTTGNIFPRRQEPQTDRIDTGYPQNPQTDQIRSSPQTGQTIRSPQVEAQRRNSDFTTGGLKTPLVRRAPYMYEDDPLRQELAQQIDTTGMRRRSSRPLDYENEEEQ
jgi:hypothetical protein